MIVYDLECGEGHAFEGWFDNSDAFQEQLEKGYVSCPICGTTSVARKLSTFGIAKKRSRETDALPSDTENPVKTFIQYVNKNFEDVGADFTKEALKMHYGVTEQRNIRGVSSEKEEETLRQEGIQFFKIPVPVQSPPDDE